MMLWRACLGGCWYLSWRLVSWHILIFVCKHYRLFCLIWHLISCNLILMWDLLPNTFGESSSSILTHTFLCRCYMNREWSKIPFVIIIWSVLIFITIFNMMIFDGSNWGSILWLIKLGCKFLNKVSINIIIQGIIALGSVMFLPLHSIWKTWCSRRAFRNIAFFVLLGKRDLIGTKDS